MESFRFDSGTTEEFIKTDEGFLIVKGYPTRTGVFTYINPDGSLRRELRHPDDVLKADSLKSLAGKPFTIRKHPTSLVTPTNFQELGVGSASNEITAVKNPKSQVYGDSLIKVVYNIHRKDGVDAIESGECRELSCGYKCALDYGDSGVWGNQRYDARQRLIFYNHTTGLARGRAGSDCGLRMDALDAYEGQGFDIGYQYRADEEEKQRIIFTPPQKRFTYMARIPDSLLDGVIHSDGADIPDALAIQITSKLREGLANKERADQLEAELAELRADNAEVVAERDMLEGRADRLQEELEVISERLDMKAKDEDDDDDDEDDEDDDDEDDENEEDDEPMMKKGSAKGKMKKSGRKDSEDYIEQQVKARMDAQHEAYAILYAHGIDTSELAFDPRADAIDIHASVIELVSPSVNLDGKEESYIEARYDAIAEEVQNMDADDEGEEEEPAPRQSQVTNSDALEAIIGLARKGTSNGSRRDSANKGARRKDEAYKNPGPISKRAPQMSAGGSSY